MIKNFNSMENSLKEVENFSYLGSEVNKDGKIEHEISRISNSCKCYHLVKSLSWNKDIPVDCKKMMYKIIF